MLLQSLKAKSGAAILPASEPAVEILQCRRGTMLAFRADQVIGRSLRLYGEWSEHELSCLRPYVPAGTTVIDVGAHIGTHTLAFSEWVASGSVIAVEPQATVMCLLQANCLLNGLGNVELVKAVCGGRPGVAVVRSFDSSNLGATAFKADVSLFGRVRLRLYPRLASKDTAVPVQRVDDLAGNRQVSLIKIDAEGMELSVLRGASAVLKTRHPVVFCEQNDTSQLAAMYDFLVGFNYRLYWLETHQFNKSNYRGERDNIWWRTETGILGIHRSLGARNDLIEVDRNASEIPSRCNARDGLTVG
ncbi:MAG: FkbM family methyltransferase [Rhizobiales bacterium]|nr:FkbM family methyltransferase [Hyphomicrobiales bacterium]